MTTVRRSPRARWHRAEARLEQHRRPVSRAALSRPETSSRTPRCWATDAAVRIGVDQRGPQSAAGEGGRQRGRHGGAAGCAGRAPDRDDPAGVARLGSAGRPRRVAASSTGGPSTSASSASGRSVELLGGRRGRRCRLERRACGRSRSRPPHRHHAHLVPVEQVDRGRVEAGRVEGDDRGVGLPGTARREQVVDVDAPLEHDHPAPRSDHAPGRATPTPPPRRRPGRRPRQPRPTTVSAASSVEASSRKNRCASPPRHAPAPTSACRRRRTPHPTAGASSTVTPASDRPAAAHGATPGTRLRRPRPRGRRRRTRRPPTAAGTWSGGDRDRHLAQISRSAAGPTRGARQQLTRADAADQPEVGRQLVVGAESRARHRSASAKRTRRTRQVVGGQHVPRPERVVRAAQTGTVSSEAPSTSAPTRTEAATIAHAEPQPRVAPARARSAPPGRQACPCSPRDLLTRSYS